MDLMNKITHGDCLEIMRKIPSKSVDMILCDLPYGTTACRWDTVIDPVRLWAAYRRVITDTGAIVLFGAQPFTTVLISGALDIFKYELIWVKSKAMGFMNAKNKPMNAHENICVFSKGSVANCSDRNMLYNPQGLVPFGKIVSGIKECGADAGGHGLARKSHKAAIVQEFTNYPVSVLNFPHANAGGVVLDNCIGSGTTAVACVKTGRNFIGIEKDAEIYALACERVAAGRLWAGKPKKKSEHKAGFGL